MTISEIAKEAGVSIATVSRFMNNGPIKEETRKKLEETVRRLNYVPGTIAHRMADRSTDGGLIAVITHSVSNPYSTEFVEEIVRRCEERTAVCYTVCCTDAASDYRTLMSLISHDVDGIIMHDPPDGRGQEELYNRISRRMPLVVVHSFPADIECNTITVNQEKGMREAMAYLAALGHERIAYISGTEGYSFALKKQIWQEELAKRGLTPPPQDALQVPLSDFEAGIEATRTVFGSYLHDGNRPTAIFTANDIMAWGAIAALRDAGLAVPADVSLVSHDNTMLARASGITSVDMKIHSVALAALDLLDYAIRNEDTTPRHISISPELIKRESCRKAGARQELFQQASR